MKLTELEIIPEIEEGSSNRLTGRFTLRFRIYQMEDHEADSGTKSRIARVSTERYELRGISNQTFQGLSRDLRFLSFEVSHLPSSESLQELPGEGEESNSSLPGNSKRNSSSEREDDATSEEA